MATSAPARVTVRSGMQPDSLKLASQLAILKMLHRTALSLDESLGDKSSGRTSFIKGIQGEVRGNFKTNLISYFSSSR